MSQQQMALLFDTSKQNISLHILNILQDKELYEKSVVKDYLTTAGDGKNYNITYSCGGFNTPTPLEASLRGLRRGIDWR
ncbi:MAG: hypothetical protein ACFNKL_10075 [Treponema sp.]